MVAVCVLSLRQRPESRWGSCARWPCTAWPSQLGDTAWSSTAPWRGLTPRCNLLAVAQFLVASRGAAGTVKLTKSLSSLGCHSTKRPRYPTRQCLRSKERGLVARMHRASCPGVQAATRHAKHSAHQCNRVVRLLRHDQLEGGSSSLAQKAAAFLANSRSMRRVRFLRRSRRSSSRSRIGDPKWAFLRRVGRPVRCSCVVCVVEMRLGGALLA